jgi:hypothetical protein
MRLGNSCPISELVDVRSTTCMMPQREGKGKPEAVGVPLTARNVDSSTLSLLAK